MIQETPSKALPLPLLRPARFEDYPQIERLESSHGLLTLPADDWRGLWLDNPLWRRAGEEWPIGWVLEDAAGAVVGSLGNIPSLYTYRDCELIAATGRGWVVASEYRGLALWLMDEYFHQPAVDLFINTTVNALAVDAFSALGSVRVPLGDWFTAAYWITRHCAFARTALRIKAVPLPGLLAIPAAGLLRLKDAFGVRPLPAPVASVVVERADAFDARFDAFWTELVRQNPGRLLGVRDGRTLSWHFGRPIRAGQAWIFTASRNHLLRAYCVLKRQDHPQSGLVRMRLVDYQNLEAEELLPGLLRAALERCQAEGIYALEHVGCDLPKMRSLDRCAPYRRKLPAWSFHYKAVDPALDADLRRPEVWDPSGFDGDASL